MVILGKSLELKKNKSGAGFTLVEILVVVGMIGVLTAGSLMVINPALQLKRSRDSTKKSEVKQLQAAMEQYRSDNDVYPNFSGVYGWSPATSLTLNTASVTYMQIIPKGVNTGGDSCKGYVVGSSATNYTIFTILENANDPDATAVKAVPSVVPAGGGSPAGDYKTYTWTGGSCATYVYNFWVNNP